MKQEVMIQIFESDFNNDGLVQTVNARDLHEALGIGWKFADWIKEQLQDFKENQDYAIFSVKTEKMGKGRPMKDYALTLDTANDSTTEREIKMNEMVAVNAARMTSLEIAELVGKRHDNVKRTVETLIKNGVITSPQIEEKPTAGRPVSYCVFEGEQGKRDSIVVVAQLCPEFTARLVDRWMELEEQVKQLAAPQQQLTGTPGTPEHFLDFITQGVTQALTQAYREYFGEPVLPAQQQHTEPVQALPPTVGVHNPCPANKISLNKMKTYVSNEALLKELINGFGLVGELFDPGCVEGTNKAARPYMVYNKNQVAAMLKAAQVLANKLEGGKRELLGRTFSVKTNVAPHLYDGFDFDAACEMILLLKAKQC